MKKALLGAAILVLLLALSIVNIRFLDGFTGDLISQLDIAEEQSLKNDFASSARTLEEAISKWNSYEWYTHIFIRHSEIDSTSDAFYELMSEILDENAQSAQGAFRKLRSRLESIAGMEHITPGSIF